MTKLILKFLLLCFSLSAQVNAFDSFEIESEKLGSAVGCEEPKIRFATSRWSGLYTCVGGFAQNVELIVNEKPGSGTVSDVALVWSDWRLDTGYGLRPSRKTANAWLRAIVAIYVPQNSERIIAAFSSNKNLKIETEEHIVEYTYRIGPSIDERKLVIKEKDG